MMNKKGYDERQMVIRGEISFETICLSIGLILISAFFADDIIKLMDMSDYLLCILMVIIGYFSVRALWKDAYLGIYENNVIIIVFGISFILEMMLLMMDVFNHEQLFSMDRILTFMIIIFQVFVIGTYIVKKIFDKKSK